MDEARDSADPLVSPRQIALTYDRVVSAHWRGETDTATAFDAWFEAHWSDQAPPEPDAPPEGTSVLGDSGAGIRWYARDATVLGYLSRRPGGCYQWRCARLCRAHGFLGHSRARGHAAAGHRPPATSHRHKSAARFAGSPRT